MGIVFFNELCYVIDRYSAHLIAKNPQIGSKTLKSLYTLRFTILYATVHVRLDRPYVTVNTSVFLVINNSAFLPGVICLDIAS